MLEEIAEEHPDGGVVVRIRRVVTNTDGTVAIEGEWATAEMQENKEWIGIGTVLTPEAGANLLARMGVTEVANAPESADAETQATLKELADELERQGVDINTVTNEDANKLLQGFLANQNDESSDISDQQDFGDIILTYPAKVRGTGKTVEISEKAQVVFDQAVKRRTAIESLMECVNA